MSETEHRVALRAVEQVVGRVLPGARVTGDGSTVVVTLPGGAGVDVREARERLARRLRRDLTEPQATNVICQVRVRAG